MIAVRVCMKLTKEPLKRASVVLRLDLDDEAGIPGGFPFGSNAYSGMAPRAVQVGKH